MSTYSDLMSEAGGRTRRKYAPDVAKVRAVEISRRSSAAQNRARVVIANRHKDEYDALYQELKAEIYAERGPLPGDED